jgi:Protein of unknown function (DUF3631)/Bifunctional DNA primase/polymerase, N-terminal
VDGLTLFSPIVDAPARPEMNPKQLGRANVEFKAEDSNEQGGADPALVEALDPARIEAYRLKVRVAGFAPIPVDGKKKKPPMEGWQRLGDATEHEIKLWTRAWPSAPSTGILTRRTPCLDADILDPEAADAVEQLARERYKELGVFLARTGLWPKRAFVFCADVPFPKITINLVGPLGPEKNEKLEFLADGQQLLIDGIHSGTGRPYSWHAERRPGDFTREDMPPIDEAQARSLVNDAAVLLIGDFGYARKGTTPKPKPNGQDRDAAPSDWTIDFSDHDSLVPAAMRLLKSGMDDGAVVNFFRANVEALTGVDEERRARRLAEVPSMVSSARAKINAGKDNGAPDPAPAPDPADAELERLAKLPLLNFERERKTAAEALGLRASLLDKLVALTRAKLSLDADAPDGLPGRPIRFEDIELWGEPVDGAQMLTELSDAIAKYVIMEPSQRDAAALGAVFAHTHDLRDVAPIFFIVSPTKRCGKTRLERVIKRLVPKPLMASSATPAFLARVIEKHRPTVLIDEFDAAAKGDQAMAETLRGQLNSSFDRDGARIGKCVPLPGGGYEEREFSTWAPTWIAGIKTIPETVEDRSVVLRLKRKLPGEKVARLRGRDGGEFDTLKRQIARFVADHEQELREIESQAPAELDSASDRAADAWEPLFAIADAAGAGWPRRARAAALALTVVDMASSADSVDIELLSDIAQILDACDALAPTGEQLRNNKHLAVEALEACAHRNEEQAEQATLAPDEKPYRTVGLGGEQITNSLATLLERRWPTWDKGKPMRPHQLARLLRAYGALSQSLRDGKVVFRGYPRDRLDDAIGRYLSRVAPIPPDSKGYSVATLEDAGENEVFGTVTSATCNASQNAENPSNSVAGDVVTPKNGGIPGAARSRSPRPPPEPPLSAQQQVEGAESLGLEFVIEESADFTWIYKPGVDFADIMVKHAEAGVNANRSAVEAFLRWRAEQKREQAEVRP